MEDSPKAEKFHKMEPISVNASLVRELYPSLERSDDELMPCVTSVLVVARFYETASNQIGRSPQNSRPVSSSARVWDRSAPCGPKADPGVVSLAPTYENSARAKKTLY